MVTVCQNPALLVGGNRQHIVKIQILVDEWLNGFTGLSSAVYMMDEALPKTVSIADLRDVEKSLKGDSEAYRHLIDRYQQHVSRIMWGFTRDRRAHEELVQDVFVEAYLSLGTFKGKAPLPHWLAGIATHVGYRFWRQSKRQRGTECFSFDKWDELIGKEDMRDVEPAEAAELVYRLLAQLPPRDRLVLTLRYIEQCDVDQTAHRTGWTKTMVKVQSWRARNRLKNFFLGKGRRIE